MNEYILVPIYDSLNVADDKPLCEDCLFRLGSKGESLKPREVGCISPLLDCLGEKYDDSDSFRYGLAHRLSGVVLTPEELVELVDHYKQQNHN